MLSLFFAIFWYMWHVSLYCHEKQSPWNSTSKQRRTLWTSKLSTKDLKARRDNRLRLVGLSPLFWNGWNIQKQDLGFWYGSLFHWYGSLSHGFAGWAWDFWTINSTTCWFVLDCLFGVFFLCWTKNARFKEECFFGFGTAIKFSTSVDVWWISPKPNRSISKVSFKLIGAQCMPWQNCFRQSGWTELMLSESTNWDGE